MNSVILVGRLVRDPNTSVIEAKKKGDDDLTVTHITLACDRKGKDAGADFPQVTAFGSIADVIDKYCKKGDRVVIRGRITTGSYENKDGNTVYTTEVTAEAFEFAQDRSKDADEDDAPKNKRRR